MAQHAGRDPCQISTITVIKQPADYILQEPRVVPMFEQAEITRFKDVRTAKKREPPLTVATGNRERQ